MNHTIDVDRADEHDDDDGDTVNSSDEALYDILGISELDMKEDELCQQNNNRSLDACLDQLLLDSDSFDARQRLVAQYEQESYCTFPWTIPARHLRRLTDELVYNQSPDANNQIVYPANPTHETIPGRGRTLTRLEHFCQYHKEWKRLTDVLGEVLTGMMRTKAAAGTTGDAPHETWTLFKEKLNLKPAHGGKGFAPHLDAPSLQVALGADGPQEFCTVMVAIDNMTAANGCLEICPGRWSADHHVPVVVPDADENPDAGGRAGAIAVNANDDDTAPALQWQNLECPAGTIVAFNGWLPHRSGFNHSPFGRRAVFLTYAKNSRNSDAPPRDWYAAYFEHMNQLRNDWRARVGLPPTIDCDEQWELQALATVPK